MAAELVASVGRLPPENPPSEERFPNPLLPPPPPPTGDALQNIWTAALRGAGRQSIGAGISLSMLWFFGVPLAITLAFHYKIGVIGMWYGLLTAFVLQAVVMVTTVLSTINMDKEADKAQQRLLERSFSIGEDGLGHLEAPLLVGEEEGLPPAP
uniref:Mate efflux family protein 9 n=1 Tax=Tetraselmis sp. GSL018 TaxID=582737 RepID=A0A061RAF2_9CHLO